MRIYALNTLILAILFLGYTNQANAELICKGSGYGLVSTYTFHKVKHGNLSLTKKTTAAKNEVLENVKGTAVHTSTVSSKLFGMMESYYYFVQAKDSYTELIAISNDMKSMARSRPDPTSTRGNFMVFTCSGSL